MAKDLSRDEHEWSMQRPPSAARTKECLMKMLDIVYTHVQVNKLVNDKANKSPNYSNPLDLCETFTRLCSAASSHWSLVNARRIRLSWLTLVNIRTPESILIPSNGHIFLYIFYLATELDTCEYSIWRRSRGGT